NKDYFAPSELSDPYLLRKKKNPLPASRAGVFSFQGLAKQALHASQRKTPAQVQRFFFFLVDP
ncbi:MAG: hypothetical protein RL316_751, partial [Bacteroidota bacterium]